MFSQKTTAGVNGLAVAPLPALHVDRHGLAAVAVDRRVRGRERVVDRDRGRVVAEEVQRPVQQVLEALGVVLAGVGDRAERPDPVQVTPEGSATVAVPPLTAVPDELLLLGGLLLDEQAARPARPRPPRQPPRAAAFVSTGSCRAPFVMRRARGCCRTSWGRAAPKSTARTGRPAAAGSRGACRCEPPRSASRDMDRGHRSPPLSQRCPVPSPAVASLPARQRHFVLATVRSERSFSDATLSSSKCHNFLSISPQASACPGDRHVGVTPLLRGYYEPGKRSSLATRRAFGHDRGDPGAAKIGCARPRGQAGISSSRSLRPVLQPRSAADGVRAAVHVHDLAGRGREPVGQQRHAAAHSQLGSDRSQPSGARFGHSPSKSSKPGMLMAAIVFSGPAATRFTRIPRGPRSRAR